MTEVSINLRMAEIFLDKLESLRPGLGLAFVCWPENDTAKKYAKKSAVVYRADSFHEVKYDLAKLNARGWHVAVKVNIFKEDSGLGNASVVGTRAIFIDEDHGRYTTSDLKKYEPDIVVKTAHGHHVYWLLNSDYYGASHHDKYDYILKQVAYKMETDNQVTKSKNLRVPGFIYHKDSSGFIPYIDFLSTSQSGKSLNDLIDIFSLRPFSEYLIESEGRKRRKKRWWESKGNAEKRDWVYDKIMDYYGPAVSGSNGNETFVRVSGFIYDHLGYTTDAFSVLEKWNNRCDPPWSDRELRAKWNSRQGSLGNRR